MSLILQLPLEIEQLLRERAARLGQRPEEFARQLVESGLTVSLEDDLAHFRAAVLASGETEAESMKFFQTIVDEVRSDKTGSAGSHA